MSESFLIWVDVWLFKLEDGTCLFARGQVTGLCDADFHPQLCGHFNHFFAIIASIPIKGASFNER
jgi:hypothetical protein